MRPDLSLKAKGLKHALNFSQILSKNLEDLVGCLGDKTNTLDEERSFTPAGGLQSGNNQQTFMECLTRVRALLSVGDASVNKLYLPLTLGNVHFTGRNRRQTSVT